MKNILVSHANRFSNTLIIMNIFHRPSVAFFKPEENAIQFVAEVCKTVMIGARQF